MNNPGLADSALFLRKQIEPPPLAFPISHHFQLKNFPSGSTNRASKFVLSPASEIASGDPSISHEAALQAMGHRRDKQAAWTDKPAQIGQDTTCIRFRKMHQRGGSPEAIERHRLKGEVAEVGVDQRQ
jgi:hypothetical protein